MKVSSNPEVVEVSLKSPRQRSVLLWNRQVTMATTPVGDGLLGPSQAPHAGLAGRLPTSIPTGPSLVVREP